MKLLLTHGYFICEDAAEQKIMKPYPPLGLLSVSAFLESCGFDHEVFDCTFSQESIFIDFVREQQPDAIAFYVNLMTKIKVLKLIQKVRNEIGLSDVKIILGGPDVSYNWENYLNNGADYVIIGEGEQSLAELLLAIKQNEDLSKIQGLAFRNQDNQLTKNLPRTKIKDIDELPVPNRKKIDLSPYLATWKTHHGKSALNISTQRGCPYTCEWCSTAVYGQSYRRRSPEIVVDEIEQLIANYQVESLWFVDDVFTVSHKWIEKFSAEMRKRNIKIPFECITRAERLNDEVLANLKSIGCFRIWIGAESGSQRIIDLMKRQVDINKVAEMMQLTRSYGIETGTFIMLGYPSETIEDINQTISYLKTSNPDHYTITLAYPIKGTALYKRLENELIQNSDWANSTDREIDFQRTYPKSFYKHAIRKVVNEVNFYKSKKRSSGFNYLRIKQFLKAYFSSIMMKRWVTQLEKKTS